MTRQLINVVTFVILTIQFASVTICLPIEGIHSIKLKSFETIVPDSSSSANSSPAVSEFPANESPEALFILEESKKTTENDKDYIDKNDTLIIDVTTSNDLSMKTGEVEKSTTFESNISEQRTDKEVLPESDDGEYIEEEADGFELNDDNVVTSAIPPTSVTIKKDWTIDNFQTMDVDNIVINPSIVTEYKPDSSNGDKSFDSLTDEQEEKLICILTLLVNLFKDSFENQDAQNTLYDNLLTGLQCIFRDCRKALPERPTKPSSILAEPGWTIRRARAGGWPCSKTFQ